MPEKGEQKGVVTKRDFQKEKTDFITGTNYLLAIGIDKYTNCAPLNNAVKDASDLISILTEKYSFQKENVEFITDEKATKDNIIDAFRKLKKRLTPPDNLVIYYSGHGELDEDFDDSYLVTVNSRKGKIGDYLPHEQLIKFIRSIQTHHTLLILDACFAGAFLVNRRSTTKSLEKDPSRYVIASGRKEFASDGVAGGNSPFATALLEKLNQNEGELSVIDLAQYVKKQTIKATNETQRPIHNPLQIKEDKGGEFIFRLKAESETDFWDSAILIATVIAISSYMRKYPNGKYTEEAYWQVAIIKNTELSYDDYLERFPNGKYVAAAEQKMEELEEDAYWEKTKARDSLTAYRKYNRQYKNGKYKSVANKKLQELRDEKKDTIIIPEKKIIQESTEKIQTVPHIIKSVDAPNTFTDSRDGQIYKTVQLKDDNIWMAQNLNFDVWEGCWFYNNDSRNGEKYGRLYTWEAAKRACPEGWHLPSNEEWDKLVKVYGGEKTAYRDLIIGGDSGFFALLGGERSSESEFGGLGSGGYYWSRTEDNVSHVWDYSFESYDKMLSRYGNHKSWARSCRCIKD